ncbi:peptidoglycan-binding domain-containing protein [Thioclava kandeliae]|uniref:Peptidoglycan-binding domain-containing protein n=1 Tax=Thioclava kandeliae TaxID=3070818 RepID=A0ABV1SM54_9RHOB
MTHASLNTNRLLGCNYRFSAALAICLGFMCSSTAKAADTNGNFAFKGAGGQTCGAYQQAWDGQSRDLLLYGGWVEGYLTAFNQFRPGTFDITPWQTTQTVLGMMKSVCDQSSSDRPFSQALWQLLQVLQPDRLTSQSTAAILTEGNHQTAIYMALLPKIRERLASAGHDPGTIESAQFAQSLSSSVKAYQTDEGLAHTGILDQQTLFKLLQSQ